MKYGILVIAVFLTGCGTINEQTLEYCDTTTDTFIGIPYYRDADCMGISNSENGTGIQKPVQLPNS